MDLSYEVVIDVNNVTISLAGSVKERVYGYFVDECLFKNSIPGRREKVTTIFNSYITGTNDFLKIK